MTGRPEDIAVIGAGPGGLVTVRWLLSQGFEPTIFEQSQSLGRQWTGLPETRGFWPTMRTNTSRILTSFLAQQYLPLVAEDRITLRPCLTSVDGTTVTFTDGSEADVDGILFGTGFELNLPFLSDEIRTVVGLDAVHLEAGRYTFHRDLPGLAFVGMWDQSGGYFVPLELHALWIAQPLGGAIPERSEAEHLSAIDAYRARRATPQKTRLNLAALTFARAAGVEPKLGDWPHLRRALLFGPLTPSCFSGCRDRMRYPTRRNASRGTWPPSARSRPTR